MGSTLAFTQSLRLMRSYQEPSSPLLALRPACPMQHTPEWKDALVRESMTGDVGVQAKKVWHGTFV